MALSKKVFQVSLKLTDTAEPAFTIKELREWLVTQALNYPDLKVQKVQVTLVSNNVKATTAVVEVGE